MSDPAARGPRLRIVAINDVYELGHLPRLATLIAELGARDPVDTTLVTLAGDFLAPSLLSSLDEGRGMVDVLDAVGVTHVTFGNHEDDLPVDALRARMAELSATWLATNVPGFSDADGHTLPAWDIVEVRAGASGRAVRVGLLGVVVEDPTVYRRPPFGGATLTPARETARAVTTSLLKDHGVDLVVPLTHLPIGDDRLLAREQRTPPYRVILGGHDHREALEWIDGTCIAKAGHDAERAIVLELAWPADPRAGEPDMDIRLEPVAAHAPDAAVQARVDRHMARVREMQAARLMLLPPGVELSSIGTRSRQTTLATVLCTRLRELLQCDVCLLNGGGIRGARVYRDAFTFADLEAELPFDNELTVVRLRGDELAEAVRYSRSRGESGGFLQVDDGVVVDPDTQMITAIGGAPLDPARAYRVALMRNLMLGMDRIAPLMQLVASDPTRVPPEGCGRETKLVLVDAFGSRLARELGVDRVDRDHDGVISLAEIAAALAPARSDGAP